MTSSLCRTVWQFWFGRNILPKQQVLLVHDPEGDGTDDDVVTGILVKIVIEWCWCSATPDDLHPIKRYFEVIPLKFWNDSEGTLTHWTLSRSYTVDMQLIVQWFINTMYSVLQFHKCPVIHVTALFFWFSFKFLGNSSIFRT